MKNPKNERPGFPKLTLASLKEDYNNFQMAGGNIWNAKKHNNVIQENLFDVTLKQVCYHLSVMYKKDSESE